MLEVDIRTRQDAIVVRELDVRQAFQRGLNELRARRPPDEWDRFSAVMNPVIANIVIRDAPVLRYVAGELGPRILSYCGVPVEVRYHLRCWFEIWAPYEG